MFKKEKKRIFEVTEVTEKRNEIIQISSGGQHKTSQLKGQGSTNHKC